LIATDYSVTLSFPKAIFNAFHDTLAHYQLQLLPFNEKKNRFIKDSITWICPKGLNLAGKVPIEMSWVECNNYDVIILGANFFKNYTLTFDWKSHQLIFDNPEPVERGRIPIEFAYRENKVTIVELIKGSKAQKHGIVLGDEVLALNGKVLEGISESDFYQFQHQLQENMPKYWKLTLRDKHNNIKEVIIEKEKYNDLFFFD
jgi:hypothetical protein